AQSPDHAIPLRLRSCQSRSLLDSQITVPWSVSTRPSRCPRSTKSPCPRPATTSPRTPEPPYHPAPPSTIHDVPDAGGRVVTPPRPPSPRTSRAVPPAPIRTPRQPPANEDQATQPRDDPTCRGPQ